MESPEDPQVTSPGAYEPLAARMRPLSLSEIAGQQHILGEGKLLRRAIEADRFTSLIFYGPPGTGKTLMAKAVANATNASFIRLIGSELVQKYIGEGARLVRELFQLAQERAPSIIFIDELDAVGAKRMDVGTTGDREVQRTLMQLLGELDGFTPRGQVSIMGASNRPDILDET